MELLIKFVSIFNNFVPFDLDTIYDRQQRVQPKWKFWKARRISKQTIFDWNKKVDDYLHRRKIYTGDTDKNIWELTYAFYGALIVESSWNKSCSFMTIAGYPSKNVPSNHQDNRTLVATCYRTIDYVYAKMPKIECDDNDTRMMRLDLAESYIKAYEESLYIAIFTEK